MSVNPTNSNSSTSSGQQLPPLAPLKPVWWNPLSWPGPTNIVGSAESAVAKPVENYGWQIIAVITGLIFLTVGLIMIFKVDVEKTAITVAKVASVAK